MEQKELKRLHKALRQLAADYPRGFTVTVPDLETVAKGWCIGHRDTQNCFGEKGMKKALEHALEHTGVLGGWRGYQGRFYWDSVLIEHDQDKAEDLQHEHKQLAIYHLETGKVL